MVKTIILQNRKTNSWHLGQASRVESKGELSVTDSHIRSDTLFSALINAFSVMYPENTSQIISYTKQGALQFSSAFICLTHKGSSSNQKNLFFVPVPAAIRTATTEKPKELNRIRYISMGIMEQQIPASQWLDDSLCRFQEFACLKQEAAVFGLHSQSRLYSEMLMPRVKVHTTEETDRLYRLASVQLLDTTASMSQFYFTYANYLPPKEAKIWEKRILAAFRLLADQGIGGERSSGQGCFNDIIVQDAPPAFQKDKNSENNKYYMSLSLTNPDKTDLQQSFAYRTIMRGGRPLGATLSLGRIRMMEEGALFAGPVAGQIPDLAPPGTHSTYFRYGKPFLIPVSQTLWK